MIIEFVNYKLIIQNNEFHLSFLEENEIIKFKVKYLNEKVINNFKVSYKGNNENEAKEPILK